MTSDRFSPSRRELLAGTSTLAAGGLLAGLGAGPALARAPMLNTLAPAFYRFKIGDMEATVISDGPLSFADSTKIFLRAPDSEIRQLLTDEFLPTDAVRMEQNILVLNTGDKLVMFDTGVISMKQPNQPSGRILTSLKEAGIEPKDIDAIVLTHPHIDHAGGIMSADGKTNHFPNVQQIFTTEVDYKYYTDEKLFGTRAEGSVRTCLKNLVPNKDKLVMMKDGQAILPGVQAIASNGHTPGHMSFMITSAGRSLCLTGDIAHHNILLRKPKMAIVFDVDPDMASASRVRMCDMLASQRVPGLIYHLPWPGIGHIAKAGDGYRFVPVPLHNVL